ncbi:hypothetical protein AB4Y88_19225 [Paenarthrobacter sp. RAF9]
MKGRTARISTVLRGWYRGVTVLRPVRPAAAGTDAAGGCAARALRFYNRAWRIFDSASRSPLPRSTSGTVQNDVESHEGPAVGLHENYSFSETGGVTTLVVELEVPDEWADDMRGMWSEAIGSIKRLAERA